MNKTAIEYCDLTWNLWTGCYHGCPYCYGKPIATRFKPANGEQFVWHKSIVSGCAVFVAKTDSPPFPVGWAPTYYPLREHEPKSRKKPAIIFVNSMSDTFGRWVPDGWLEGLFDIMEEANWHRYLILTKDPKRMQEYLSLRWRGNPPNHIYCGTTCTTQADADERIPLLLQTPAAVRFVSWEPALSVLIMPSLKYTIDWLIAGAMTGPGAIKPQAEWFDEARARCAEYGIAYFEKSSLASVVNRPLVQQYPEVRQ